jgi:hypothetical protein
MMCLCDIFAAYDGEDDSALLYDEEMRTDEGRLRDKRFKEYQLLIYP